MACCQAQPRSGQGKTSIHGCGSGTLRWLGAVQVSPVLARSQYASRPRRVRLSAEDVEEMKLRQSRDESSCGQQHGASPPSRSWQVLQKWETFALLVLDGVEHTSLWVKTLHMLAYP